MTHAAWDIQLRRELDERRTRRLTRRRLTVGAAQGRELQIDGTRFLAFCSNDYLGLASHPELVRALQRGAQTYGVGAGASHLVTGHMAPHQRLEEELAHFVGAERALVFSTGYMANMGIAEALVGRHDTILEDRLNHASLIDAGRLARAQMRRYPHADVESAAKMVQAAQGRVLIATDAVFSMDGDLAPVQPLRALAVHHDARVLLDDAHGIGVLGAAGGGTLQHLGLPAGGPVLLMGTLGKAFGTFGAFVAGDAAVIEYLLQHARTYIYTTAPPPAMAEATRTALRLVRDESWRREHVLALSAHFRSSAGQLGLSLMDSGTPIQPIVIGESGQALAVSRALAAQGLLVTAIRPPTVPQGSARLRVTFSASHRREDVDRLLEALGQLRRSGQLGHE